jgi:hypothetical protein
MRALGFVLACLGAIILTAGLICGGFAIWADPIGLADSTESSLFGSAVVFSFVGGILILVGTTLVSEHKP